MGAGCAVATSTSRSSFRLISATSPRTSRTSSSSFATRLPRGPGVSINDRTGGKPDSPSVVSCSLETAWSFRCLGNVTSILSSISLLNFFCALDFATLLVVALVAGAMLSVLTSCTASCVGA